MDIHWIIRYSLGYATPWNPSATRSAKASCCSFTANWQDVSICGRDLERIDKLCGALGPEISPRWEKRSAVQAGARATAAVNPVTEAETTAIVGARLSRRGIHDGSVDPAAYRQTDPEAFRDPLPPGPRVAGDDESGMDVPEAGAPSHTERRGSHRPLEEIRVAAYKKKLEDLGPISCFSTKAGFSSSLTSARPGRRSVRPRSSGTATGGIGFLPFLRSPYPPRGSVWGFTSDFTRPTSRAWKLSDSCVTSSGTCEGRSYFCGMEAPSTGASSSRSFCADTSGSMCIGSRLIPQRSTRTSSSGPRPRMHCPMVRRKTSPNSDAGSAAQSIVFETRSDCFGPAFTLQVCHGPDERTHYLCESQ